MKTSSGLFTRIYQDIINDHVNLPHLPDITIKLRKALSNDNYSIDTIARIIQTDVSSSAYLLNIANSALYKTRASPSDIQSAIRIMGISTVRNLVNAHALKSITLTDKATTKKYLNAHWQRSAYLAAIANAIAKMVDNIDPDLALLAGLLSGVGALPVLMKLDENDLINLTEQDIQEALNTYTAKVGIVLARKWQLNQDLQLVIKNSGNLAYDSEDQIDLVDVVNIAKLLSQIGTHKIQWPRLEDSPCLRKFSEDGLTMETSIELLKEARADIGEIKKILGG
ncbi:MAG: HDOD domain-containing protein [Gammaproteobacteria bacterium]|nr:HDOD domain-containing protein [Gammaproteobacteria bacterium]